MMKKMFVCGLAALSLLGAGCGVLSRNDYVENAEYDLELPENSPVEIRVGVFRNISGSDRRFLMRRKNGQLIPLEYQRWRMSPDLLLQRCVYGAFTVVPDNDGDKPRLNAVIYRFEFDERDDKAHLAVDFSLPEFHDPVSRAGVKPEPRPLAVRVDVAVPVNGSGDPAAARAAAMSECARLAVAKLSAAMNKKAPGKGGKK